MRVCLSVAVLFLFSVLAAAQTSFDEHFQLAKQGKLGQREEAFAKQCGVQRSSATITYGESLDEGWDFKRTSSVGRGREDAAMDYFGTAEMWSVAGKPRLLNLWFLVMDVGRSNNEMFCLDDNGRVVAQESLGIVEPVDGDGDSWIHLRRTTFLPDGRKHAVTSSFLSKTGAQIASPKLSPDDFSEAMAGSDPSLAEDVVKKLSSRVR